MIFDHPYNADSALENRQAPAARATLISAIPVRSPSHGSEGLTGPANHRLTRGWLVFLAYAVFGTKRPPVQIRPPRQGKRQVTRYLTMFNGGGYGLWR